MLRDVVHRVLADPVGIRAERPEHAAYVAGCVDAYGVSGGGRCGVAQGGEVQLRGPVTVAHGVHASALHGAVDRHTAHVAQAGGVQGQHELLDHGGESRAAGRGSGVRAGHRRGLEAEAAVAYVVPVQGDGGRFACADAALAGGERGARRGDGGEQEEQRDHLVDRVDRGGLMCGAVARSARPSRPRPP